MLKILSALAVLLVGFLFFNYYKSEQKMVYDKGVINIGSNSFFVEIADDELTRVKGLSDRKTISSNQGMFFVFEQPGNYGFWMKDMLFAIDIIWIDQNFVINHIEKNISPDTYPKLFYSNTESMYVLELLSGSVDKFNIKIGDKVILEKNNEAL